MTLSKKIELIFILANDVTYDVVINSGPNSSKL